MTEPPLIEVTDRGLFCRAGGFYIDPWRTVDLAVVTHAHGDHARWGCGAYLTSAEGKGVLQVRMGPAAIIEGLPYGETRNINGVTLSLHPAGHILGSSQVRLEFGGEVWVFSGDYKTVADVTCSAFEPVRCDTFITESTFGLPIYRWRPQQVIFDQVNQWWRDNVTAGRSSAVFAYSLGKAQRVLAGVDPSIGPILLHGAVANLMPAYEEAGIKLPAYERADLENAKAGRGSSLIVAPPSAMGSPWMKKFGPTSLAFASGWMVVRGARRWKALDRGFVLSDHADWPGLMDAIAATGATRVGVTHGFIDPMVRYLKEQKGLDAFAVPTRYKGDDGTEDIDGDPVGEASAEDSGSIRPPAEIAQEETA